MDKKIIVLVFIPHYIPGYKAGGGIRSIKALAERLTDRIHFKIITGDRDLGADAPYENMEFNRWLNVNGVEVMYISQAHQNIGFLKKVIRDTDHDIQYYNSFWSPIFTWMPILSQLGSYSKPKPKCIAPKGEFTAGALAQKKMKKKIFCFFISQLQFLKKIYWHASSLDELTDIKNMFLYFDKFNLFGPLYARAAINRTYVVRDLPSYTRNVSYQGADREFKSGGRLKICFLSRISAIKNLGNL